jgi:hypothetical protein
VVSQEGHSAQLLKVKRDEAPAGGSSREQAHGGLRDADTTKRLLKVPRLGRGGEVRTPCRLWPVGQAPRSRHELALGRRGGEMEGQRVCQSSAKCSDRALRTPSRASPAGPCSSASAVFPLLAVSLEEVLRWESPLPSSLHGGRGAPLLRPL